MSQMLFGKLLELNYQKQDSQLNELDKELKFKLEKAKTIASSLKSSPQDDDLFNICSSGELLLPQFNKQVNYNEEFWKTYLKNQLSFALIKELSEKTNQLQQLLKQIEKIQEQYFHLHKLKNRKKNRRLAIEIEKKFECPYQKCYKFYGSDVSLNLHIKLKHNGGNKTDREKLAQQIIQAQISKTARPEMKINLPPGFLEVLLGLARNFAKIGISKKQIAQIVPEGITVIRTIIFVFRRIKNENKYYYHNISLSSFQRQIRVKQRQVFYQR